MNNTTLKDVAVWIGFGLLIGLASCGTAWAGGVEISAAIKVGVGAAAGSLAGHLMPRPSFAKPKGDAKGEETEP